MTENLSQPWILARLSMAFSSVTLALIATVAASRILGISTDSPPDERALRAERDGELAAAGLSLALVIELAGALGTVLVAHRLSSSVRGAMCAYGVLAMSPHGHRALIASATAALVSAAWLGVRAVDARIARGSLSRTLARGAWLVTAAIVVDALFTSAFLQSIDLRQHASCCSTGAVDRGRFDPGAHALGSSALGAVAVVAAAASVALIAWMRRAPSAMRALLAAGASFASSALVLAAARDVLSPYAFGSPAHRCVYCLLRVSEASITGPMFIGSWALATLASAFVASAAWVGRRTAARAASEATLRSASVWWIACWLSTLLFGLWPIVLYRAQAGTWALFGR